MPVQVFLEKVNREVANESVEEKLTRFEILAEEIKLLPDAEKANPLLAKTNAYLHDNIKSLRELVAVARLISEIEKVKTDSLSRQNEARVAFLKKQEIQLQHKLEKFYKENQLSSDNQARLTAAINAFKETVKATEEQWVFTKKLAKEKAIKGAISTHIELYLKQLTDSLQSVLSNAVFNNELKIIINELNALCENPTISFSELTAIYSSLEKQCPGWNLQSLFNKLFPLTNSKYQANQATEAVIPANLMLAIDDLQDYARKLAEANDFKTKAYGVIAENLSHDLRSMAVEFYKDPNHLKNKTKVANFKYEFSKLLHCKDGVMGEHRSACHGKWRQVVEMIANALKKICVMNTNYPRIFTFFGASTMRERCLLKVNDAMEKSLLKK